MGRPDDQSVALDKLAAPPERGQPEPARRLRVLVVASLFPHAHNETLGLSTHRRTVELARLCDVQVVSLTTRTDLPERETLDGLDVVRPRWRRVPKIGVVVDGYRYAARAERAVRELRPALDFDLIDAHWLYPDGFAAVRLGARLGKPVALTGRGSDVNDYCFRWPVRRFARAALRGATRLFAVSRQLAARMAEAGAPADRITVVPNGVDTTLFRPGDRDAAREALGLPPGETILLSVGGLVESKGFQQVVEALAQLGPGPRLYIAGFGAYEEPLRRLAAELGVADRVTVLGRVMQQQMPLWYQAADLFCFGSWREGCPNVVLEALACGTPAISTDVGGIPDLVDEGQTGLLFEPRSPEACAEAIREALARPWDRAGIAEAGSRRTWDRSAREYFGVFTQMIDTLTGAAR